MTTQFLAGAAQRVITPAADLCDDTQHSNMSVRFDETGSTMYAKALAMSLGETNGLLIVLDVVVMGRDQCDVLRQSLARQLGLQSADVVISCTHSHSTPFPEPLDGPRPFYDLVCRQATEAAAAAWAARRPARLGHDQTHVVGASFNHRKPLPNNRVKFARDYREGLATGRPIDPRLSVIRIDDEAGLPIAGWVRFAAHPACVIFDTPVSAEYPGYMTEQLSASVAGGVPVLFGYGASGDVNCLPMFGTEHDARNLGLRLADLAAPVLAGIETLPVQRFTSRSSDVALPLDVPPAIAQLDREIAAVETFIERLDDDPELEWVLDVNFKKAWSAAAKQGAARPLAEWARKTKAALQSGHAFPTTWPTATTAWVLDDLGLIFFGGEPFTELGLDLAARSPLSETLLMSVCNGSDGYVGADEDRHRGGYEMHTSNRYAMLKDGVRPLPYALGAGGHLLDHCVALIASHTHG